VPQGLCAFFLILMTLPESLEIHATPVRKAQLMPNYTSVFTQEFPQLFLE